MKVKLCSILVIFVFLCNAQVDARNAKCGDPLASISGAKLSTNVQEAQYVTNYLIHQATSTGFCSEAFGGRIGYTQVILSLPKPMVLTSVSTKGIHFKYSKASAQPHFITEYNLASTTENANKNWKLIQCVKDCVIDGHIRRFKGNSLATAQSAVERPIQGRLVRRIGLIPMAFYKRFQFSELDGDRDLFHGGLMCLVVKYYGCSPGKVNGCDVSSNCHEHATCTPGSGLDFTCTCKDKYVGDGLTCSYNFCNEGVCGPNSNCVNKIDGYDCPCKAGYSGYNFTCTEINECGVSDYYPIETGSGSGSGTDSVEGQNALAPCGEDVCVNTPGSYQCQCRDGFINFNNTCTQDSSCTACGSATNKHCVKENGNTVCLCRIGFTDGPECGDINECEVYEIQCDEGLVCRNEIGTYNCRAVDYCTNSDECDDGYSCAEDDNSCVDVDECIEGTHDCHANAKCINKDGTFECECLEGYAGDGKVCVSSEKSTKEKNSATLARIKYQVVGASVCLAYVYQNMN